MDFFRHCHGKGDLKITIKTRVGCSALAQEINRSIWNKYTGEHEPLLRWLNLLQGKAGHCPRQTAALTDVLCLKNTFPRQILLLRRYCYVVSDISRFFQPVARKIFLSFILYKWPQHCNHLISVLLKRHFITFEKTFHPWVVLNRPCTYLTSVPACMLFSKESFFWHSSGYTG